MKNVYKSTNLNEPLKDDLFIVRFFISENLFFCSSLNFFNRMLKIRFNTNMKRHFLKYMLTSLFNFTTYDGATITNERRKNFK